MNAKEYLSKLHSRMNTKPFNLENTYKSRPNIYRDYQEFARIVNEYSTNTVEGLEKYYRQYLVIPFLNSLPDIKGLLEDIVIGVLPICDPNAWCLQVPRDGNLIVLHTELLAALSFYNELQTIAGKQIMNGGPNKALDFLNEGNKYILSCFKKKQSENYPLLPNTLDESEYFYVIMKTMAQELFILAHEYAHIYLGHTGKSSLRAIGNTEHKVFVRKICRSQQQELDADVQAVLWLTRLYEKGDDDIFLKILSKSVGLAVEALMLFHIVQVNFNIDETRSSHPSPLTRLSNIGKVCASNLNQMDKEFIIDMVRNASDIDSFRVKQ